MAAAPEQHNLTLILARSFVAHLATAVFLFDTEGTIIYYNEAAERLTGRPFIEGGAGNTVEEWMERGRPLDEEGREVPMESLPLGWTILKREPAHGVTTFRIKGEHHRFENVTFPLFAHTDDLVGAMAMIWPVEEDR